MSEDRWELLYSQPTTELFQRLTITTKVPGRNINGKYVIEHGNNISTLYAHLSKQIVKKGIR